MVQLETSLGSIKRPIIKLYPLELSFFMQPGELKEKAVSSDQPTEMIIVAAVQIKMIETRQLYILNVKYSVRGRIY